MLQNRYIFFTILVSLATVTTIGIFYHFRRKKKRGAGGVGNHSPLLMDVVATSHPGILSQEGTRSAGGGTTDRSPAKSGLRVNFSEGGEVKERREKFLTAKYGHHQMSLIRKRLAVEMWLYEEVKKLYETNSNVQNEESRAEEVEVDIDELLDMDSEDERRKHLQSLLINAKKSQNDVKKFINDLLDKAKTL